MPSNSFAWKDPPCAVNDQVVQRLREWRVHCPCTNRLAMLPLYDESEEERMPIDDEDTKVRRNLVAYSAAVLLLAWLQVPIFRHY